MKAPLSASLIAIAIAALTVPASAQSNSAAPTVPATTENSRTRAWVARYFEGTRSGSAATWASSFAENAAFNDPVGFPIVTGRPNIEAGGKNFLGLTESFVHAVGNRAVAGWTGKGVLQNRRNVTFEGVNVFEFDASGKVTKLEGYWDPTPLLPQQ